jgi:hypothetical protein
MRQLERGERQLEIPGLDDARAEAALRKRET